MNAWMISFVVALGSGLGQAPSEDLEIALRRIDDQRNGRETRTAELEAQYVRLLELHRTPAEHGRIRAHIARLYAQDGLRSPEKLIEACEAALKLPLDELLRGEMHVACADGLEARALARPEASLDLETRRAILAKCWQGLVPLLAPSLPDAAPPIPAVRRVNVEPSDPEYAEQIEAARREAELRRIALRQRTLIEMRTALLEKCARMQSDAAIVAESTAAKVTSALGSAERYARYRALLARG